MSEHHPIFSATGSVKWFHRNKGYGFILCAETGDDILLHINVLRQFGQTSLAAGAGITLMAVQTKHGKQAVSIQSITPPNGDDTSDDDTLSPQPARVKWFDHNRGFGFVELYGSGDEAFIHTDVIRDAGLSELDEGEALSVKVAQGPKGLIVRHIGRWVMDLEDRQPPP